MSTRTLTDRLSAWQHARATVAEDQIYQSDADADYAQACGLPTLAALCALLARLADARGPIGAREIEAEIRAVLAVAVGEGTARLRLLLDDPRHDGIPGVPAIPAILLEREHR